MSNKLNSKIIRIALIVIVILFILYIGITTINLIRIGIQLDNLQIKKKETDYLVKNTFNVVDRKI